MTEHMALCLHVAEKHDILLAEKQDVSNLDRVGTNGVLPSLHKHQMLASHLQRTSVLVTCGEDLHKWRLCLGCTMAKRVDRLVRISPCLDQVTNGDFFHGNWSLALNLNLHLSREAERI